MRNTVRWVDVVQKLSRMITPRREDAEEYVLICTGGTSHLVFLAAQLEHFRQVLGGAGTRLVVLARHDAGAAFFLFDGRAEIMTVDMDRLGRENGYRGYRLSEMFESNFKGIVSLDYHRHPYLDEALVEAGQRPAMSMKPAPLAGLDSALAGHVSLYKGQFDSGPEGTPIPVRWRRFIDYLSVSETGPPSVEPYRMPVELLPEPATSETPTVLLQPFSPDSARQPSGELYAAMLDAVPADHQVLLLGDADLLERSPDIKELLARRNVSLEITDLAHALPLMRSSRLVISADSAPLHLSALCGAPTLGLAPDVGNGDLLPYPENRGPEHAHILFGDKVRTEAAAAVKKILSS